METTGKLIGASRTFNGQGIILTFEVDASSAGQIENMKKMICFGSGRSNINRNEVLTQMLMHGCL